jgi:hypothetical protein
MIVTRGGAIVERLIVRRARREGGGVPEEDSAVLIELSATAAEGGWDGVSFLPREFAGPQPIRGIRPAAIPDQAK